MVIIFKNKQLVLVDILYYRPDYRNLLQSFVWQTEDEIPGIPRVHEFLNYWHHNIDAIIKEVIVSEPSTKTLFRNSSFYRTL